MATLSVPQPRVEAPGRHTWLIATFALLGCAAAGGYALALHDIEALYIGVAAAACIAILFDLRLGAILLVLLLPVSSTALFPHALMGVTGLNPINVLLAGTLAAYLLRGRFEHTGPLLPRPLLWLYIVPIVAAGLLGVLYVDEIHPDFFERLLVDFTDGRGYLRDVVAKPMLTVLAAVLVAAAVAKARKAEPFIAALAVGACALACVMFGFMIAAEVRLGWLASPRARSFFLEMGPHANSLGRVFVTAYALLLFAWWDAKHAPAKLALFVALGILSFGILFTFSRNAFLGFFLVNALFLVWRFNAKKLALAVLGAGIATALAPAYVYRRITYGFDSGDADAVSAGRVEGIWAHLLPETLRSPLWGNGLDSTMWSYPLTSGAMDLVSHPHNAYLEALLDMGLIGLALLLAYYWHVWRGFRALRSNAYLSPTVRGFFQGACAALIAFAVAGMSGGSLRPEPENVPLWIAIGIMYGLLSRRPAS
jgi:O-antigen ligase